MPSNTNTRPEHHAPVPAPQPPRPVEDLPVPLTFFLTGKQRAEVLARLRRIHPDRAQALRRALRMRA